MLAAYIRSQNGAFSIFRLVHEYDAKIAKGNTRGEKNFGTVGFWFIWFCSVPSARMSPHRTFLPTLRSTSFRLHRVIEISRRWHEEQTEAIVNVSR
jgi:hypothetical protein